MGTIAKKKVSMPKKKRKRGLRDFPTPILSQNIKKLKGDIFWGGDLGKKWHNAENN